eukprot:SAG22_NODE_66_length_22936_cov_626.714279_21_plen_256_part_00
MGVQIHSRLPDCVGEHDGSVVVEGPSAVTLASPLVCDVETGECLADVCLARGDICAEDGPVVNSMRACHAGSTCIDAECVCSPSAGGIASAAQWAAASDGADLAVCLAGDVNTAVGVPCANSGCSATITVANAGELRLDCSKALGDGGAAAETAGLCRMLDRLDVTASATLFLNKLLFDGLTSGSSTPSGSVQHLAGGAVNLEASGIVATVCRCAFRGNSTPRGVVRLYIHTSLPSVCPLETRMHPHLFSATTML